MPRELDRLLLRIEADASRARKELKAFEVRTQESSGRMSRSFLMASSSLGRFTRGIVSARGGIAGLVGGAGLGLLAREAIQASIAFDRINNRFRAATGSAEAAEEELAFVRAEAERLGLPLEQAALQLSKLEAAAKGSALEGQGARDIFVAVAESSTVLGLSAEQTEGALRAVEQIISKGKVQAEELRGQLGERLPGAFQIAARAIGVTTQELDKMLELGEVTAERLLPALAIELRRTFGPEVEKAAQSGQAQVNRFNSTLFELKLELAQTGFAKFFVDQIDDVTGALREAGFALIDFLAGFDELEERSIDVLERDLDRRAAAIAGLAEVAKTQEAIIKNAPAALAESFKAGLRETEKAIEEQQAAFTELLIELDARTQVSDESRSTSKSNAGSASTAPTGLLDDPKFRKRLERERKEFARRRDQATKLLEDLRRANLKASEDEIGLIKFTLAERLKAIEEATLTEQEAAEARVLANKTAEAEIAEVSKKRLEEQLEGVERVGDSIEDVLDSAVRGQIKSWEDLGAAAVGVLQDILAEVLRTSQGLSGKGGGLGSVIAELFSGAFSGGSSGLTIAPGNTTGAGGAGFSFTTFGGPRARGGPVMPGRAFLVGEEGPEPFIPRSAGTILPNESLGAQVNIKIVNNTGAQVRQSETRNAQGGRDLTFVFEEMVGQALGSGGPATRALTGLLGKGPRPVAR